MQFATPRLLLASALSLFAPGVAFAAPEPMIEFDPSEAKALEWQIVNDGVMGGLSKGNLSVSDEGILTFQGKLSLENNGGFSSIRTGKFEKDLSAADGLAARVRGDGRTYQLRVYTKARYRGMRISFKAEFPTEDGKWTKVRVPFDDFVGSFRGRLLKDAKFDPSQVQGLGLLLADKKAGPFKLEVDWIRAYAGGDRNDLVSLALADGRFKTLAKALTEAGLVEALQGEGPFTVFAPTDEAFAKLPEGTVASLLKPENREKLQAILKYHVLGGAVDLADALKAGEGNTVQGSPISVSFQDGQVKVNGAVMRSADLRAGNGIIHVIDSVLLPPEPANDLAAVAKRAGQFSTLLAAVEAAGLSEALSGDEPLTILAPTDEAFAALPKGTVEALLTPENRDQLKAILTLHAIPGKISAGDALNAGTAQSLSGEALRFGITDGLFQVNGVTIRKTGITCDNGIIHVLDAVLLPSAKTEETSGPKEAMRRIEEAVERGVPIFNDGRHGECAQIYRKCMVDLSDGNGLDARIKKALDELVKRADRIEDDSERAWVLRGGLDHLYGILSNL